MRNCSDRSSESGFTLAGLIVIMTVIAIFVAYTVPQQWSKIMERERDKQTIFAMKQVARAIYEFRRKNNALPVSLKQIEDAKQPRFFRGEKLPVDPVTGEADWMILPPGSTQQQGVQQSGISGNRQNDPNLQQGAQARGIPAKDWVGGPFIGIRPNRSGKAFLTLNGQENYEQWSYTVEDLTNEINARAAALLVK
ncbi:MAG TPA: type II secretion system protein [Thermoanaerobaculia bacterium]|jgi:type II secretory pathway pseudopilin PulG